MIICKNWDSFYPQPLTCGETGKALGILMPRVTQEVLRASPGLQGWSKPTIETRIPGE